MRQFLLLSVLVLVSVKAHSQKTYNILSYGASPISLNNTLAIQNTIDDCSINGGGIVQIPAGVYTTGTLVIKSNVELNVTLGGVLQGVLSLDAYPVIETKSFSSVIDAECQRALIFAESATNIKITGKGIINGNGSLPPFAGASSKDRPFGIRFVSCKNVQFNDITLIESGFWMQHIANCDSVSIDGIKIINHGNSNNDGINLDCVKDAWVRNSWVDTSDDGIAIKSTGERFTENILVENCTLKTLSRGIKIGTESVGGFRNIVIQNTNCNASTLSNPLVLPGQSGFSINSVDGAILENIRIENVSIEGYRQAFLLRLGNRGKLPSDTAKVKGAGSFKNVLIKNVTGSTTEAFPSIISGIPGHLIENVRFEDVSLTVRGGYTGAKPNVESIPENERGKPSYDMFGSDFPCKGFFIRHAKNIQFQNYCISELIPDSRPFFASFDFLTDNTIKEFSGVTAIEACYESQSITAVLSAKEKPVFTVYPNPSDGKFYIQANKETQLGLFNSLGARILEVQLNAGENELDVTSLPRGFYFAQAEGMVVRLLKD